MLGKIFLVCIMTFFLWLFSKPVQAQLVCAVEAAEEYGYPASCVDDYLQAEAIPGRWNCVIECITMPSGLGNYHCGNNCYAWCDSLPCEDPPDDEEEEDPTDDDPKEKGDQCSKEGNPCIVPTGNKFQAEVDYVSANGHLQLVRYYSSRGAGVRSGRVGFGEAAPGRVGINWTANFLRAIILVENPSSVWIEEADGRSEPWKKVDGAWQGDPDSQLELVETDSGFEVLRPNATREYYNKSGALTSEVSPAGLVTAYEYGSNRLLSKIIGPFGRSFTFEYNDLKLLDRITGPAGEVYQYRYDAYRLTSVIYPDGSQRHYLYEDPNYPDSLTGLVNENGVRQSSWSYDEKNRVKSSERANGTERLEFTYNNDDSVGVTAANGATRHYTFEKIHRVRRISSVTGDKCDTCLTGDIRNVVYDEQGYSSRIEFVNGATTRYERDARGLATLIVEADGDAAERRTKIIWHDRYRLPLSVTTAERTESYTYSDSGQLLSRATTDSTSGASRAWHYEYNARGLLVRVDGPREDVGDVLRYEYDARGNRVSVINALGQQMLLSDHDAHGNPRSITDPNGVVIRLEYDARQRLVRRSVQGAETVYQYTATGQVQSITDPTGVAHQFHYNASGRLTRITNSNGVYIEYSLDDFGNPVQVAVHDSADVIVYRLVQEYDRLNRVIAQVTEGDRRQTLAYDAHGNVIGITDAKGLTASYQFDALHQPTVFTDRKGHAAHYRYDAFGRLVEFADAAGLATTYTYDAFGNLLSLDSPDTGVTTHSFDAAGNRVQTTDARGVTMHARHDALNRLQAMTFPDSPEEAITYDYDSTEGGNFGVGRLTKITNSTGSISMVYDARGNVVQELRSIKGTVLETDYRFDAAGRLTQINYPSGRTVRFDYGSTGEVAGVATTTPEGGATRDVLTGVTYLPFGPLQEMTYGNGVHTEFEYTDAYRLKSIRSDVLAFDYEYDPNGNVLRQFRPGQPLLDQSYEYDELDRLISASGDYGTVSYTYDAVGNRLGKTQNDDSGMSSQLYQYASTSHQLVSIEQTADGAVLPKISFDYNPAGNLEEKVSSDSVQEFHYNVRNRLIGVVQDVNPVANYAYNALGQRVWQQLTGPGTDTEYLAALEGEISALEASRERAVQQIETLQSRAEALQDSLSQYPSFIRPLLVRYIQMWQRNMAELRGRVAQMQQVLEGLQAELAALGRDTRLIHYDLQGNRLGEYLPSGAPIKEYIYLGQRQVGVVDYSHQAEGRLYYLHSDHLGTPKVASDETGAIVWSAEHLPFGQRLAGDDAALELDSRFRGQFYDRATGLHYNYLRDYDPATGRYIQSDPIGLSGGVNTYAYVGNRVITRIDPWGLAASDSDDPHSVLEAYVESAGTGGVVEAINASQSGGSLGQGMRDGIRNAAMDPINIAEATTGWNLPPDPGTTSNPLGLLVSVLPTMIDMADKYSEGDGAGGLTSVYDMLGMSYMKGLIEDVFSLGDQLDEARGRDKPSDAHDTDQQGGDNTELERYCP